MRRFAIKKSVLTISLGMIIYYFIMEYYYEYFIVPNYSRFGFNLNLNMDKYIETKFLFAIVIVVSIFVSKVSEFTYAIFIFFIIFFLVPSLVTYSYSNQMAGPLYSIVIMMLCLGTISVKKIRIPGIKPIKLSNRVLFFCVILLLVPILIRFGVYLNVSNLLLKNVYDTRDWFDLRASAPINYLFNWLIKAIVPVAIVYFLIHKRYWYAFASFFILIYLYAISGNKMIYVTAFVMLFFYFFGKDYIDKAKKVSILVIVGLIATLLIDYYFNSELKAVFVMRMLFLHAYLNYYYFDLFSSTPLYFAESHFFSFFSTYPYDRPIGYIIAQIYIHVNDMNANNGVIGDGYMNLGYIGVGINILIVSLIFLFFNSLNLDSRYLGVFFLMIFLLLNVPFLTMLVTGGVWIVCLMGLTIMKKQQLQGP